MHRWHWCRRQVTPPRGSRVLTERDCGDERILGLPAVLRGAAPVSTQVGRCGLLQVESHTQADADRDLRRACARRLADHYKKWRAPPGAFFLQSKANKSKPHAPSSEAYCTQRRKGCSDGGGPHCTPEATDHHASCAALSLHQ